MKEQAHQLPVYRFPDDIFDFSACSGNNRRQLLVLAAEADIPDHLPLLHKIIRAIGFDFEDDLAFGTVPPDATCRLLAADGIHDYKFVLLFGLSPLQMGMHNSTGNDHNNAGQAPYLRSYEQLDVIISPALAALNGHPESKRDLWNLMKHTFES